MKAFLAPKVRKSVSEELTFTKYNFLDLVNFSFSDLTSFAVIDRFLIFLPILSPLAPLTLSGAS